MMGKEYNKKIFSDFFLNILAVSLLIAIVQLVVNPYLSRIMSADKFGTVLTIMAVATTMGVAFGGSLSDTRILKQNEYDRNKLNGDYNVVFILASLLNAGLIIILTSAMRLSQQTDIIACILISSLVLFRSYFTVAYRLIINYKKFVYTSVFGVAGYIVGIFITAYTKLWYFPFVLGELFSCIYILLTSSAVKDKFKITSLFNSSIIKYSYFFFARILSSSIAYMDRFFLYPIIGAEQVAVFTVASYLGKAAFIVMIPVSNVLLTYHAKQNKLSVSSFLKQLGLFAVCCMALLAGIYLFGMPVLRFLYPTIADDVYTYFYIANLAVIVNVYSDTIQPTLLRYARSGWQIIIHGSYVVLFVIGGYIGLQINGLMGFCYSMLIVNSIKVVFMMMLSYRVLKRAELIDNI